MKMIEKYITAYDVAEIDNNKVVFSNCSYNSICELDLSTNKCRILSSFDSEDPFSKTLYKRCVKCSEKIFFAPAWANNIAVYNYKMNKCEYISIRECVGKYNERINHIDAIGMVFAIDGFVYMCGYFYPAILKIDATTLQVTYIDDWVEEVDKKIPKDDSCGFIGYGYWDDKDYIYLPIGGVSGIIRINKHNDKTKIIWIETEINGFCSLSQHENKLWMIESKSKTGILIAYDVITGKTEEIKYEVANDKLQPYSVPYFEQNLVLLFPIREDKAIIIDTNSKKVDVIEEMLPFTSGTPAFFVETILFSKRIGNYILLCSGLDYCWYKYDITSRKLKKMSIELENYDYMDEVVKNYVKKNNCVLLKEGQIGLSNYLRIVKCID